jgi:hypothetical protein
VPHRVQRGRLAPLQLRLRALSHDKTAVRIVWLRNNVDCISVYRGPHNLFQAEFALHRCRHMSTVLHGFYGPCMRSGCTPGTSVRVRQKHARARDGSKLGSRAVCFDRLQSEGCADANGCRYWLEHNGRSCRQPSRALTVYMRLCTSG